MLLGAGLVLGAILVVGTGGAALPFLVGAVLTGAAVGGWIGEFAGSLSCFNEISGKIARGSPDVFINFIPAARTLADIGECSKHGPKPQQIVIGSESVFIDNMPAARVKDKLQCSSFISEGSPDVFIGGAQVKYTEEELDDEVAWQYRWLEFGAGIAGALLMGVGVPVIVGGFAGGYVGSKVLGLVGSHYGEWLSENIGGEPDDWAKTGAFIGGAIGGWLGAKGGPKAWNLAKRIEVDPNVLGMNGGNIRIRPNEPSGLENRGYRPKPGERSMTRAKWEESQRNNRLQRNVPPRLQDKILYGERVANPASPGGMSNRVIGGHSSSIKTHPDFAFETISNNADGTTSVKFIKQFPDGKISQIKKSTLAPDHWSNEKITATTNRVSKSPAVDTRARDGATLHRETVDGVQWEVIKDSSGIITSSYPTGGIPSQPGMW
jgi:uncharacterized Zn-binding protein involved in type VI secretion